MKGISLIKLLKIGFNFLVLFPLIPNRIKGLPVVFILVISFFIFISEKKREFNWKFWLINSSVYLFYAFTILYTYNLNYALKKLETSLSLIAFPLIFSLLWKIRDKINFKKLLINNINFFFHSIFLYAVIIISRLIYVGLFSNINDPGFSRHFTQYVPLIGQHPIYASMYLGLGFLSFLYLIQFKKNLKYKFLLIMEVLFIFLLLVLLASKGVLISTFVAIIIYCLLIISNRINRIIIVISILGFLIFSIKYTPSLSNRFNSFKSSLLISNYKEKPNSTQTRKIIYNCSLMMLKNNWIFGYGIGDVNDQLKSCYEAKYKNILEGNFNAHNQYLSIFLSCGLLGLVTLFYFLYYNFKILLYEKNYFCISVFLFFIIIFFIENILERQSGVILFSFFINFFSFINLKKSVTQNI
jgi:O-antigen ligase